MKGSSGPGSQAEEAAARSRSSLAAEVGAGSTNLQHNMKKKLLRNRTFFTVRRPAAGCLDVCVYKALKRDVGLRKLPNGMHREYIHRTPGTAVFLYFGFRRMHSRKSG